MNSYRDRVYLRYSVERIPELIDGGEEEFRRSSHAIEHRVRRWLPTSKQARILDVACGGGQFLYTLKGLGYCNVSGVDISPAQIEKARKICRDVYERDAIQFLREHADYYDHIFGFDIIEHFRKDELFEFVDALYSALRPGGTLVLQTPNAESPWGMMYRYGDLTHENAFEPKCLKHVLSLASFSEFETSECGPYVHGIKSFVRWCLWRIIRRFLALWNLIEIGTVGSGIYTRVFMLKAQKPRQ